MPVRGPRIQIQDFVVRREGLRRGPREGSGAVNEVSARFVLVCRPRPRRRRHLARLCVHARRRRRLACIPAAVILCNLARHLAHCCRRLSRTRPTSRAAQHPCAPLPPDRVHGDPCALSQAKNPNPCILVRERLIRCGHALLYTT
ncbi:hypothetical protein PsYK624_046000 [Phanerochaete sordida]|uniref:Uncharacterized protein n=1 Tax=Phanerochaete sordida TaxID=48140 RepID=A0A9P3G5L2_9APHY|nr:hypothetical protein PsYK624_046000 [Phanerochaete sordida]